MGELSLFEQLLKCLSNPRKYLSLEDWRDLISDKEIRERLAQIETLCAEYLELDTDKNMLKFCVKNILLMILDLQGLPDKARLEKALSFLKQAKKSSS